MLTTAQKAIFHIVASAIVGVGVSTYTAVMEYASSGNVNLGQVLSYLGIVLVGGIGSAGVSIWHSVASSPALPQAESDTASQVLDFLSKDFAQFVDGHFGHLGERLQALEASVANHSHVSLPTPPAPSNVVQIPFPPQGTMSQFTGGVIPSGQIAIVGDAGGPNIMAPQPQAPLLGTIPNLAAVPRN